MSHQLLRRLRCPPAPLNRFLTSHGSHGPSHHAFKQFWNYPVTPQKIPHVTEPHRTLFRPSCHPAPRGGPKRPRARPQLSISPQHQSSPNTSRQPSPAAGITRPHSRVPHSTPLLTLPDPAGPGASRHRQLIAKSSRPNNFSRAHPQPRSPSPTPRPASLGHPGRGGHKTGHRGLRNHRDPAGCLQSPDTPLRAGSPRPHEPEPPGPELSPPGCLSPPW